MRTPRPSIEMSTPGLPPLAGASMWMPGRALLFLAPGACGAVGGTGGAGGAGSITTAGRSGRWLVVVV
jgi:hypothetical protein